MGCGQHEINAQSGRVLSVTATDDSNVVRLRVVPTQGQGGNMPATAHVLLRRAVRGSGLRAGVIRIFRSWSRLYRVTADLCAYFTDIVPTGDGRGTLISRCVTRAVADWGQAEELGGSDGDRYQAYLVGLFSRVPEAGRWCVCYTHADVDHVWDPASGSLSEWWGRHAARPRVLRRAMHLPVIADTDLRMCVAARILTRADIVGVKDGLRTIVGYGADKGGRQWRD